tara:strand:- start:1569 stop:2648 length:1080 start_codon:yes stop_codon:yes gene_type:complete
MSEKTNKITKKNNKTSNLTKILSNSNLSESFEEKNKTLKNNNMKRVISKNDLSETEKKNIKKFSKEFKEAETIRIYNLDNNRIDAIKNIHRFPADNDDKMYKLEQTLRNYFDDLNFKNEKKKRYNNDFISYYNSILKEFRPDIIEENLKKDTLSTSISKPIVVPSNVKHTPERKKREDKKTFSSSKTIPFPVLEGGAKKRKSENSDGTVKRIKESEDSIVENVWKEIEDILDNNNDDEFELNYGSTYQLSYENVKEIIKEEIDYKTLKKIINNNKNILEKLKDKTDDILMTLNKNIHSDYIDHSKYSILLELINEKKKIPTRKNIEGGKKSKKNKTKKIKVDKKSRKLRKLRKFRKLRR